MNLDWWEKEKLQDKMPFLRARNLVKNAIHKWFAARDFTEVETSQLQTSPGNEVHLLGLETSFTTPDLKTHQMFLATSPEFSHKKLIAGGMERIYEFARVFRNRDLSKIHTPEFTMLEFYRANENFEQIICDTLEICRHCAKQLGVKTYKFKNIEISIDAAIEKISLQEAFLKYAQIDMLSTIMSNGETNRDEFARLAQNAQININDDDDWSNIFTKVLIAKIEPNLGIKAPTILYEYPLPEGALAQKCAHDPRLVERFELYICGIEIANGFGELIDAIEQRKRFENAMQKQYEIYGNSYRIDEELLKAMEKMPPTSGVAIGFDRLIMVLTGARNINDTLWSPFDLGSGNIN